MNILITVSATPHASLTHRALNFGAQLAKRGHNVTMLAPRYDKYSKFEADMAANLQGVRMRYPWHPKTRLPLVGLAVYMLTSSIMVLTSPADLGYVFKPTPISLTGFWLKMRHKPMLADFDDLGQEVMELEGQPGFMAKLVGLSERLAAKWASGLSVASTLLERELTATHKGKPVSLISNGVNMADFTPTPASHDPKIVFFGALGRTNLLAPAIEAIAKIASAGHSHVQAEILGDGPAKSELEALSTKLGASNVITFRGWTKPSEVSKYAHSGDIALCIMPDERTTAACSNQKIFQYGALGLSVIATTVGDLPLYLDNGTAGSLVKPGDARELATAITNLLENPRLRTGLASTLTNRIQERYTWAVLGEQVSQLVAEVAPANSEAKHA